MKLKVTIGCAACRYTNKIHIDSHIDCDGLTCPCCGNENCMSIISVIEEAAPDIRKQNTIQKLQRIRQL